MNTATLVVILVAAAAALVAVGKLWKHDRALAMLVLFTGAVVATVLLDQLKVITIPNPLRGPEVSLPSTSMPTKPAPAPMPEAVAPIQPDTKAAADEARKALEDFKTGK